MKKVAVHISALALVALPAIASAQLKLGGLADSIRSLTSIVNLVVGLLLAVEVVVFIWGIIKGVLAGGDPAKAAGARQYIIWSIVAITATLAVWGLAHLLLDIFGIRGDTTLNRGDIPQVQQ